jgi:hypothetical protein
LVPSRGAVETHVGPAALNSWLRYFRALRPRAPDWWVVLRNYQRRHGKFPRILNPITFNEKIIHRVLFDRRPLLREMTDKVAMRRYVTATIGSDILPKLYFVTSDTSSIPFDTLPERFVVKPTHGSGWVRIVKSRSTLDRNALAATCAEWLSQSFYEKTREWSYKQIAPRILFEELVEDGAENRPTEYKLFVFNGRVRLIQSVAGELRALHRRLYTPGWKALNARLDIADVPGEDISRPPHLTEMISAAESLGANIDFVRADFYDTRHKLYFGELTTTPACGNYRSVPPRLNSVLGAFWTAPKGDTVA